MFNRVQSTSSLWLTVGLALVFTNTTTATILWSDLGATLAHETGDGTDILGTTVKRDNNSRDTLYFKFHVDPLSDVSTEEYFAGFELFEGTERRLAVGNAMKAWAYSAFHTSETGGSNKVVGDFDLYSSRPERSGPGIFRPYELPRRGAERTIVFKVQYVADGDDQVTVWLSPNLSRGATDDNQLEILTTRFKADASFDQIHLRHGGGGGGWVFSDMAIATSFSDFIIVRFWETWWFIATTALALSVSVGGAIRFVEKRRVQRRMKELERERALEHERARIAQDLHDDLGAALSRISLLSDMAKAGRSDASAAKENHVHKISQLAGETLRALDEIVWAVRPGSDSLQSLVDYIAHFANELFKGDSVRCRLDLPDQLPARTLLPELRHNIFLIAKESLTNAFKHSDAHEVLVQIKVDSNSLEMLIKDDGCGFEATSSSQRDGNGLENISKRAEAIGAELQLDSTPGKGTSIRLHVDLDKCRSQTTSHLPH